jgi:hypothetical protein
MRQRLEAIQQQYSCSWGLLQTQQQRLCVQMPVATRHCTRLRPKAVQELRDCCWQQRQARPWLQTHKGTCRCMEQRGRVLQPP